MPKPKRGQNNANKSRTIRKTRKTSKKASSKLMRKGMSKNNKQNNNQVGGINSNLEDNIEMAQQGFGFGEEVCDIVQGNEKKCISQPQCQWVKLNDEIKYCEPNECNKLVKDECSKATVDIKEGDNTHKVNKCMYYNNMCISNKNINNPAKNKYNSSKIHFANGNETKPSAINFMY